MDVTITGITFSIPQLDLLGSVSQKLDTILTLLENAAMIDAKTQTSIDNMNAAITANTTVLGSMEALENGQNAQLAALKAQLAEANGGVIDPAVGAAIDAATAIIAATNAGAAAAVVANTPAATS